MFSLQPPRHIWTLPLSTFAAVQHFGSDRGNSGLAPKAMNPALLTRSGLSRRIAK